MVSAPPADEIERPRSGSWLDKSARRVSKLLLENFGLAGTDTGTTYLAIVAELSRLRDDVSDQFSVGVPAAQRRIGDDDFLRIATRVAEYLGAELPAADPFADDDRVQVLLSYWVRATLSLQLAALASRRHSDDYAWALMTITTQMTDAQMHGAGAEGTIAVPRAATVFVARTLEQASARIAARKDGYKGVSSEQLAGGLTIDSMHLRMSL
jgi:hypothetical protein